MDYTEHYQLCLWDETDRILMDDFNDSYEKIDAALKTNADAAAANAAGLAANTTAIAAKGNCQLYWHTYVGTGSRNCSFPLPGQPDLVMVLGDNICIWGLRGGAGVLVNCAAGGCDSMSITCGSQSVSWSSASEARYACNKTGESYVLLALLEM